MEKKILDFEKKEKENRFQKRSVLCLKISIFLTVCTFVLAWNNESYYVNDGYGIAGIASNLVAFLFSAYGVAAGVISYIKKEYASGGRGIVLVINLILMVPQGLLGYVNFT